MLGNHSLIHYHQGQSLLPPVRGLKTAFRQKAHVHALPEVVPDLPKMSLQLSSSSSDFLRTA
jgi:hypothetical protein